MWIAPEKWLVGVSGWHSCKNLCDWLIVVIVNLLSIFVGSCGHGKQRRFTLPTGDWEDQEPLIPQPNVDHEHREKAGSKHQDRGVYHTYCTYEMHTSNHSWRVAEGNHAAFDLSDSSEGQHEPRAVQSNSKDQPRTARVKNVDEQPSTKLSLHEISQ